MPNVPSEFNLDVFKTEVRKTLANLKLDGLVITFKSGRRATWVEGVTFKDVDTGGTFEESPGNVASCAWADGKLPFDLEGDTVEVNEQVDPGTEEV